MPTATHVSVHTDDPTGTGANEYARQPIVWRTDPVDGVYLSEPIEFQLPAGEYTLGFWDGATFLSAHHGATLADNGTLRLTVTETNGVLSITDNSGPVLNFTLVVGILDDVLDQAPTSIGIVVYEGWPEQRIEVRIDDVAVGEFTLNREGELGPTSVEVPDTVLAGGHVLTVVPVTEADASASGSAIFRVRRNPDPDPYPVPLDADPLYIAAARRSTGVHRWVLQDLMPGGLGSWVFERNPIAAAPLPIGRDVTQAHTVSLDGQFHISDPVGRVSPWSFNGAYFTEEFQTRLLAYAALNRRLYLIDHRNRAWTIAIVGVDLTPRRRVRNLDGTDNDHAGEYVVRCLLFGDEWKEPR